MTRIIYVIVKDCMQTQFMQHVDVFEKFKFVGRILKTTQKQTHFHLTAEEVLGNLLGETSIEPFEVVGVVIPGIDSAFLPNHAVMSNGEGWITVKDLVQSLS